MKVLTVIVVAVVAVAAVGAAVVLMNNDGKSKDGDKTMLNVDTTLAVYGNADGNAVMDNDDVKLIEEIIAGSKASADYPLADANKDDTVDSKDVELVKKMINRESCTVNALCLNKAGDQVAVPVGFPLKNVVPAASNMNAVLLYIGAQSSVAGIFGYGYPNFESAYNVDTIPKFGGSSTDISAGWSNFLARDAELHDGGQGGVGAVIIDWSKSSIISDSQLTQLSNAGIPVMWYSVTDAKEEVSATLALGFLIGGDALTKSQTYAEESWKVFDKIKSLTSTLTNEQKASVIAISMGNKVPKNGSDSYDTIRDAGGIPYWEINDDFKAQFNTSKSTTITTGETLSNYDDAGCMMSVRSIDAKSENLTQTKVTTWDTYYTSFYDLDNYDKLVYVNNLLPGAIKLAYMLEILYPSLVEAGYGNAVFNTIAGVCAYLDGCTLDNTFTKMTYDDYIAAGGTHAKSGA